MAGSTNYPGAIDSVVTIPTLLSGPPTHKQVHEDDRVAIIALQNELGVNGKHRTFRSYSGSAARDVANPSPLAGHVAWLEASDRFTIYDGAEWWNWPRLQSGLKSGSTDGSGRIRVTFPQTFAHDALMVVSFVGTMGASGPYHMSIYGITTTYADVEVWYNGALYTSSPIQLFWIATERVS